MECIQSYSNYSIIFNSKNATVFWHCVFHYTNNLFEFLEDKSQVNLNYQAIWHSLYIKELEFQDVNGCMM
jgi:hypothetical protein